MPHLQQRVRQAAQSGCTSAGDLVAEGVQALQTAAASVSVWRGAHESKRAERMVQCVPSGVRAEEPGSQCGSAPAA